MVRKQRSGIDQMPARSPSVPLTRLPNAPARLQALQCARGRGNLHRYTPNPLIHPRLELRVTSSNHITVVDDEADITQLLATYLTSHGFRVTRLETGHSLIELFATDPPALVLLDLGLPGEDGFSIAKQVRDRGRCGLVIVTGPGGCGLVIVTGPGGCGRQNRRVGDWC